MTTTGYTLTAVFAVLAVLALVAVPLLIRRDDRKSLRSSEQDGTLDVAPSPRGTATGVVNRQEAKPMPTTEPRYKTLAKIESTLRDAGVDADTIAQVREGYQAKNPSAFSDESTLSDAEFRKKTVEFTRRHLRRFPRTQSALALSLAALAKGETTTYIK